MANWKRIAGTAAVLAALSLQAANGWLMMSKSTFLIASNNQIQAVEAGKPSPGKGTRGEYLEASLAAERECKQLYVERSLELDRYFLIQSGLMVGSWFCLFTAGLVLRASSSREPPSVPA